MLSCKSFLTFGLTSDLGGVARERVNQPEKPEVLAQGAPTTNTTVQVAWDENR